jgi:hypothetical protein
MNWKNILISVLSAVIALLGGTQYQQLNSLNEAQKSIKELQQGINIIANKYSE